MLDAKDVSIFFFNLYLKWECGQCQYTTHAKGVSFEHWFELDNHWRLTYFADLKTQWAVLSWISIRHPSSPSPFAGLHYRRVIIIIIISLSYFIFFLFSFLFESISPLDINLGWLLAYLNIPFWFLNQYIYWIRMPVYEEVICVTWDKILLKWLIKNNLNKLYIYNFYFDITKLVSFDIIWFILSYLFQIRSVNLRVHWSRDFTW